MIVVTAVSTRFVGTAAKKIFVPAINVGTNVPTKIDGTAVPTIIVLTAYYWKSCNLALHFTETILQLLIRFCVCLHKKIHL